MEVVLLVTQPSPPPCTIRLCLPAVKVGYGSEVLPIFKARGSLVRESSIEEEICLIGANAGVGRKSLHGSGVIRLLIGFIVHVLSTKFESLTVPFPVAHNPRHNRGSRVDADS